MKKKAETQMQWYRDIQENPEWQKATQTGKRAVRTFVRAIMKRQNIEQASGRIGPDSNYTSNSAKYAMAGNLFWKWLFEVKAFGSEIRKIGGVPVITIWRDLAGTVNGNSNIATSDEYYTPVMIDKQHIKILMEFLCGQIMQLRDRC